jgi:hypothetical protein
VIRFHLPAQGLPAHGHQSESALPGSAIGSGITFAEGARMLPTGFVFHTDRKDKLHAQSGSIASQLVAKLEHSHLNPPQVQTHLYIEVIHMDRVHRLKAFA